MKLSRLLIVILAILLLSSCSIGTLSEESGSGESIPTGGIPSSGEDKENEEHKENKENEDNMNNSTESRSDGFVMRARVDAVGDVIEVTVIDAPHGNTGVFWVLTSPSTQLMDADGTTVSASDITPGDTVKITYSGQVMLSYPPRIAAQKIEIMK